MEQIDNKVEKKKIAKEAILNATSNLVFLFCLWLMTMLVELIIKDEFYSAGNFTIAISVSAVMTAIATYNIGSFFASDINNEFDDCHYFYFGGFSCLLSMIVGVVLCFIYGYGVETFLIVIFYNIYKMFDNYSYITRIIFHRHNKLTTFSILLFGRGIVSIAIFTVVAFLSKSLLIAMACLAALGLLYFALELFVLKKRCGAFYKLEKGGLKKSLLIFYRALPVCLYGLCVAAMLSVPRLLFENITQDTQLLGRFGTMSSITALITSATGAIILPFIPKFAHSYEEKDPKGLIKYVGAMVLIIASLSAIAFLLVVFAGDWALSLIYGESILSDSYLFKWLVLVSCLQSIVVIFSDTLVSIRKLKFLLIGNIAGFATLASIMYVFISHFGVNGVLYTYYIGYGVSFIILITLFAIVVLKLVKNNRIQKQEND